MRRPASSRRSAATGERPGRALRAHRAALVGLGVLVVAALLAGSAWLILMAHRHPDPALDGVGAQILRMPLQAAPAPGTAR